MPRRAWLIAAVLAVAVIAVVLLANGNLFRPAPMVLYDCAWSAHLQAWVDENENGTWDASEPPLPGVTFRAEYTWDGNPGVRYSAPTDLHGDTSVGYNCGPAYTIRPDVPGGYRLTTPERRDGGSQTTPTPFQFGFARLPGAPTAVPLVSGSISCTTYNYPPVLYHGLYRFALASGGDVWGITRYEVVRFSPAKNDWQIESMVPVTMPGGLTDLAIGKDAVVWIGGAEPAGAASYDGAAWKFYGTSDGLGWPDVVDVETGSAGEVWFAAGMGVSRLDPASGEWNVYRLPGATAETRIAGMALAPDGTVWVQRFGSVASLTVHGEAADWRTYPLPESMHCEGGCDLQLATTAAGDLWAAGREPDSRHPGHGIGWLGRLDPETQAWTVYDATTTGGALLLGEAVTGLALTPGGRAWLSAGNGLIRMDLPANPDPLHVSPVYYPDSTARIGQSILAEGEDAVWTSTDDFLVRCAVAR